MSSLSLSWFDYLICAAMLLFSTLIGIYFGCFGTKQATAREYLLAGKKMRIIPIAVSIAISHIAGTALIAFPADVYRYGASIWLFVLSFVIMGLLAIFIYLPVFYKLQVNSVYEYLERRFDKKTRTLAFVIYVLSEIFTFPIHAFTPSLTFATASGLDVNWVAFVICSVCVLYTAIGGLKTVVWTDFLQFVIIMVSLITVYIVGLNSSGGFLSMWKTAMEGQRLEIFNFGYDLSAKDNFWGYALGCTAMFTTAVVVHQTGVQKYLTLRKYSDYVWSTVHTVIIVSCIHTFCVLIGLGIYARYRDCDLLTAGKMAKHDQLLPFYITDVASNVPGVAGLFIAAVCSASLSSMSSNLNALSGVVYEYIVCLLLKSESSQGSDSRILKLIVVVIGIVCTCLVFTIEKMGDLFAITVFFWGITQGPLLGVFTLGVLFPRTNSQGAFYGTIGGFIATLCLAVPAKYYQLNGLIRIPTKPLSTSGCDAINKTMNLINTTTMLSNTTLILSNQAEAPVIFKLSYYFYTLFGALMTIIFGLVLSYLSKTKSNALIDRDLLSPLARLWLPKECKRSEVLYSRVARTLEIVDVENK